MKHWIMAFRPRTLPLAFAGWLVGVTLASYHVNISWSLALLTLLTAFLLQLLSNLANDYGDAVSGVDSDKRAGPDRMVQSGRISRKAMKRAMALFTFLCLISGLILVFKSFPENLTQSIFFIVLGLVGIAAAIKYTVGDNPYGYAGFGDLFVFVFFGIVLVGGTSYLQTKSLDWLSLLPAASMGAFSVGVLNVNNIRDISSDKKAGKNSIPVRIGKKSAVVYHAILLSVGLLATLVFTIATYKHPVQLLFLITGLLFYQNALGVANKPLTQLDPELKKMALSTLLFAVLFATGQWIANLL
ncbi:MAG: 1,4-dihydroxy-2-naphthoate octaprenyltransferase [Bacteroidota bacterium]